jgi:uncharacterized damage-inducible protein DinB
MKDKTYLKTLMQWNTWANEVTYRKVSELPPEEIAMKRKTPLESIFVSLHHLLNVDDMWLHHMRGEKHDYDGLRVVRIEDFDALWAARKEMDATLEAYVDGLSANDIEEVVNYELIGGNRGAMSRAMCLTHLALHGSYHRGWISDMFGQAGVMQPTTDLPVFERALRTEKSAKLPV